MTKMDKENLVQRDCNEPNISNCIYILYLENRLKSLKFQMVHYNEQ